MSVNRHKNLKLKMRHEEIIQLNLVLRKGHIIGPYFKKYFMLWNFWYFLIIIDSTKKHNLVCLLLTEVFLLIKQKTCCGKDKFRAKSKAIKKLWIISYGTNKQKKQWAKYTYHISKDDIKINQSSVEPYWLEILIYLVQEKISKSARNWPILTLD